MIATTRFDDCFLDRRGCGDELYSDRNFKAAVWLADLAGEPFLRDSGLDLDFVDDADESAGY